MLFHMIEKVYRNAVYSRADADGSIFYFSAEDFDGLHQEPFVFVSSKGHKLQGYFYYYDTYVPERIIMFEHGMGSGHKAYMKEIERIARQGYLVFTYDHTGCTESGGESNGGFVHSLIDLNDAINALQKEEKYREKDISVVGHSWGGFSALNIAAFHPEVSHIVAMAGFVSVSQILRQFFGGILSGAYKRIYEKEKLTYPEYIESDAISALKKTDAKVLIIHSKDDKTVSFQKHFAVMQKKLGNRGNIRFLALDGKNHNPNFTREAVVYKDAFFADYQKKRKKKLLQTAEQKEAFIALYDWNKMTEQDETVWNEIFETLEA
ncbi:MAG: alpha/beta fold hydrolase [Lachnospiraceae bacterium]|nr:alpha/beta fold hydrolase [Lachnospiraceae bacterium]